MSRVRGAESGSASVLLAGLLGVLVLLTGGGLVVAGYALAAGRARAAGDLVAVSAAAAVEQGRDPCAAGRLIANRNDVTLTSCRMVGDAADFVVSVTVSVTVRPGFPGLPGRVLASAHAGPAPP